jgi:hypothetical protein
MTQYSDDFSALTTSTRATVSATTAISGWTFAGAGGSQGYWCAEVTTDGTDKAIKIYQFNAGWGTADSVLDNSAIGSLGAGVETEWLLRFKLSAIPTEGWSYCGIGRFRANARTSFYSLALSSATQFRLFEYRGTTAWTAVGAAVTKTPVAETWYWLRVYVSAAGAWSWRVSTGDAPEARGTWDVTAASDTTTQAGTSGLFNASERTNVSYDWWSAGTNGDFPSQPASSSIAPLAYYYRQQ